MLNEGGSRFLLASEILERYADTTYPKFADDSRGHQPSLSVDDAA